MADPRNVAHKKKVSQEKHHHEAKAASQAARKSQKRTGDQTAANATTSSTTADTKEKLQPNELEKSLAVLAKLKDLEFHSRANIEALAQLSLTVEEELKQREFAEAIGEIYSAQEAFHSKVAAFIETYRLKCEDLQKPSV